MTLAIAFVGTGFVADYYMTTLVNHPQLRLAGAWDHDPTALARFTTFHGVKAYRDLDALLADDVLVVNLTTPESHYAVNRAALEAGRHVYCEKPLAMSLADAREIVDLAATRGLTLCGAPANALSDAFALAARSLAAIGRPRLAYAAMEDGPVFRANWQDWRSRSGAPWPGAHEFETGCTLEHAGYALSWLVGLFGPVRHVTAFSALAFPDKGTGLGALAPDFSVGCLEFESGTVARLTTGLAAPRDRSLAVMGERGQLTVRDLWDDRSAVHLATDGERTLAQKVAGRIEAKLGRTLPVQPPAGRRVPYPTRARSPVVPAYPSRIDFARGIAAQARGIAAQARAVRGGPTPFFSGEMALHLTELVLALNEGRRDYTVRTRVETPALQPTLAEMGEVALTP